jgi:hypothetical protein
METRVKDQVAEFAAVEFMVANCRIAHIATAAKN